jgi:hypothetical protein
MICGYTQQDLTKIERAIISYGAGERKAELMIGNASAGTSRKVRFSEISLSDLLKLKSLIINCVNAQNAVPRRRFAVIMTDKGV